MPASIVTSCRTRHSSCANNARFGFDWRSEVTPNACWYCEYRPRWKLASDAKV